HIFVKRDTVPPSIIASTPPHSIALYAPPIEYVPDAQAVTEQDFNPLAPVLMETCPAAMSGINIGTKYLLSRLYPLSINLLTCFSYVSIPPIPQPIHTPTRSTFS